MTERNERVPESLAVLPDPGMFRAARLAQRICIGIAIAASLFELLQLFGSRRTSALANLPVLLITTFGRRTGKPCTNAVVYIEDGQGYLVSATNGGSDWDPGWYRNLRARPEAKIEIGDKVFNVQATIAEGEERTRLYEQFKAASGNFVKYEQGTSRLLPVIRLTPISVPQKATR